MTKICVDITMSLDGYVTGPSPGLEQGLGVGGEALHHWAMAHKTDADERILASGYEATGVVIMGRRTFDIIDAPDGWNDDVGYGAARDQSTRPPNIVLTHNVPDNPRLRHGFTFVTGGPRAALDAALELAGTKDIVIMGGADVAGQFLRAALVDELRLHIAPVILGAGTPLWKDLPHVELAQTGVVSTPYGIHTTYSMKS